jgi:hypothetical protein
MEKVCINCGVLRQARSIRRRSFCFDQNEGDKGI